MRRRIPPTIVFDQNSLSFRRAGLQLERPGAIGVEGCETFDAGAYIRRLLGVIGDQPALVKDVDVGQVVEQQRIRAIQFDVDRMVVNDRGVLVGWQIAFERRGFVTHPLKRGQNVLGGEIGTILKFHTFSQLEAPSCRRHDFPLGRQCRLDLQIAVIADKTFVDMVEEVDGIAVTIRIGVKRHDIARRAPSNGFRNGAAAQESSNHPSCRHGSLH